MTENTNIQYNMMEKKEGIFGFGFNNNAHLDLLNLIVLACSGIIIKLFFQENYNALGNSGPASTTIWGYGMTALALFIMIFMSLYLTSKTKDKSGSMEKSSDFFTTVINLVMTDTLPILLTFGVIIYIIYLNFVFFERINSNNVSSSYHTYSFFSSLLLIIQIALIVKYMYSLLSNGSDSKGPLIKSVSYVLVTINFIFTMIIHILLAFFSTDG